MENREYDFFVAQTELERGGDLQRGAARLAHLLAYDPAHPAWLDLLERYFEAVEDPLGLYPESETERVDYAEDAVRAWFLHRQSQQTEALRRLLAVVRARPDTAYLEAWALEWLEVPGTVESLPQEILLDLLELVLERYPEHRCLTVARGRELERFFAIAERCRWLPELAERSEATRVGLLRKTGRLREALEAAETFSQSHPGWHAHLAEARVRRECGHMDEARAAFDKAVECPARGFAAELDAAQMYLEHEDWDEACAWYDRILEHDSAHPSALPSSLYCRWKQTGDPQPLDHLWSLLNDDAFRPRTRQLYRRLVPFVGYLPEVRDVTANVLRKIRAEVAALHGGAQDGVYQLTLEHLEAPSNNLAFRLMTDSLARRPRLATTVQHVPEPDPRRPCRPVKYLLWTFHDTDPWPAMAPPQGDVAARVAELAAEPYDYEANWASASRLAAELLPTDATSLLAVMVRPPPLPPGEDVLVWLPRVQLVAARVLAHLDGGWRHSIRRETLLSALWGPADWTTVAAIIALAQLAQEMEAAATDIRDAFATLATHQPREAYCCYEYALYCNWLLLPNVPDEERQRLETRVQQIEATWPEADRPQGRQKSPPTRSRQR